MRALAFVLASLFALPAFAHDFAPGRLDVERTEDGFVAVLAVPVSAPAAEGVRLVVPEGCRVADDRRVEQERVIVVRTRLVCEGPVRSIEVAGLLRAHLDVFTQIDGAQHALLGPAEPALALEGELSVAEQLTQAVFARTRDLFASPAAWLAALALGLFGAGRDRRFVIALLPLGFAAGYALALPGRVAAAVLLLGAVALAARREDTPIARPALALLALAAGVLATANAPRADVAVVEIVTQCAVWSAVVGLGALASRYAPLHIARPVVGVAAAFLIGAAA